MTERYDVIVAGLGAMGSATLFHLARRGLRVLGLEQFEQGHSLGSSHGDSRIIREQYFEHPLYVPLVQRAHVLWHELEELSGQSLMTTTGGLMIGPAEGTVVRGAIRSATEHRLKHSVLSAAEVHEKFAAFDMTADLVAVWDPNAGILNADASNAAHIAAARRSGAEVRFGEAVREWKADGSGVHIETKRATYNAERMVITAGGWTASLLSDLSLPLVVERQAVFWLDPAGGDYDHLPIYAYEYKPGFICYGFRRLARGVRAAVMHGGEVASNPDGVRRAVIADEVNELRAALHPVLPHLARAPVRESGVCLFTNTSDHDFLIDWHPHHPNVLVSSPCSGHGFKFASAIGELQADLLTAGRTSFDISPFAMSRFAVT